jgi:hypothetical protein
MSKIEKYKKAFKKIEDSFLGAYELFDSSEQRIFDIGQIFGEFEQIKEELENEPDTETDDRAEFGEV